jgi:hypothetical protein
MGDRQLPKYLFWSMSFGLHLLVFGKENRIRDWTLAFNSSSEENILKLKRHLKEG